MLLTHRSCVAGRSAQPFRKWHESCVILIGTGFMFVEIAAMQRLVLLLGDPVHGFAVTLAAFLAFAGIGSGVAARLDAARSADGGAWTPGVGLVAFAIAGLAALHALVGPWLLAPDSGLGAAPRAVLAAAMIAPLAFCMGLPFPLVLARLRMAAPALVPWAWGVNGCASVVAAVLAGLLAMSFGARRLTALSVLAYMLAAFVQRGVRPPGAGEPSRNHHR